MQRVRIGLTGLGFVFVAVLLAASLTSAPHVEAPVNGSAPMPAPAAEPKEPLAELGVAPGNADNPGTAETSGTVANQGEAPAPAEESQRMAP